MLTNDATTNLLVHPNGQAVDTRHVDVRDGAVHSQRPLARVPATKITASAQMNDDTDNVGVGQVQGRK